MTFDLICHRLGDYTVPLAPARPERAIFDRNRHAYRCLPVSTANAAGWEMLCPSGITIEWDGGPGIDALAIHPDDPSDRRFTLSNFAQGIVTFETGWLFRTSPGYSLWAMASPNEPKDGISALSGIIESDWLPYPFTMNWQMTRPGKVRFEAGEPFCFITPTQLQQIQACQPVEMKIADAPQVQADLAAWTHDRRAFLERLSAGDPDATKTPWRRFYFKGAQAPGAVSPTPEQHINKLRAKAPQPAATAPKVPSTFHLDGVLPSDPGPRQVRTAEEAAALGILLVDQFLDAAACDELAHFYASHPEARGADSRDPYWDDRIVQFSDVASADGVVAGVMTQALARALPLAAAFHRANAPVYADVLQLVGWEPEAFMRVHADNAHPDGSPHPMPHRDYSGLVYLNDDYEGGGLYLPRQNVVIRPRKGMFVSLPGGASHIHGVERVRSGSRYTMPFFITRSREKASRQLHPETATPLPRLTFGELGSGLSIRTTVDA